MADPHAEASAFFERVRRLDLAKVNREIARLRTVDFQDAFAPRERYRPAYCKADTPKTCAKELVDECKSLIDTYNQRNKDKAFMMSFLETSALGQRQPVRADRAELIYQAGEVLKAYRNALLTFLKDKRIWDLYTALESRERDIYCRVMPSKDIWYTLY